MDTFFVGDGPPANHGQRIWLICAEKYARALVSAIGQPGLAQAKRSPLRSHQSPQSSLPPASASASAAARSTSRPTSSQAGFLSTAMLARSCLRSTTLRSIPRQAARVGCPNSCKSPSTWPHFNIPHRPDVEGVAGRFKESTTLTTLNSAVPPPLPQMLPSRHPRES